ncbi:MAG: hypothetical protein L6Q83_02030 [Gammaproteobacteria bacterium]|jgi:uncharacterized protein involved in exopolysaccharide biosynthesis|nr:hypothetical protein [Gammaproteobacteria bacterium]
MNEEPALRGMLLLLRKQWPVVLAATVAGGVLFFAVSFLVAPRYRAEVVLAPQTNSPVDMLSGTIAGQLGGLGSLLGIGTNRSADVAFALAILESVNFTRRFVIEENIPFLMQQSANRPPASWRRLGLPAKLPTELQATKAFDLGVRKINEDSQTGLVTLRIDWVDRNQAADWANKLAMRLNEEVRVRTIREADERIIQVRREIEREEQVEVRSALAQLLESELKRKAFATASSEYAFRIVDPAVVPEEGRYSSPRRALLAAVGLVMGLLAGLMLAVLREQLPTLARAAP